MSTYSDASLIMPVAPNIKAGKIYCLKPTDGTGDFTVSRASQGSLINSDLKIQNVANNVPRFTYDTLNGCPSLLTEPQSTNLITYPVTFPNSYWTKIGATIEGDSVFGTEQVTDGDMSNPASWTTSASASVGSGVGTLTANTAFVYLTQTLWTANTFTNKVVRVTYTITANTLNAGSFFINGLGSADFSAGVIAPQTVGTHNVDIAVRDSAGTDNRLALYINATSTSGAISIDNVSVKEVQGFSSPHVDYPTSAFKLVEDTSTGIHGIYKSALWSTTNSSASVYVEKGTATKIALTNSSTSAGAWFDLDALTVDTIGSFTGSIEVLGNFYRVEANHSTGSSQTFSVLLWDSFTGVYATSTEYTGTGKELTIFGAQLEQQSVATSFMYNGTEGATVTRNADVVTGAGDVNTFNDSEGVLFAEIAALANDGTERRLSLQDNGTFDAVRITFTPTANSLNAVVYNNGANQFNAVHILNDATTFNKIAIKYKQNDFALWVNGIKVATDTNGSVFSEGSLDKLAYELNGIAKVYAKTKQLQYFNTSLSDEELALLTSL
jgi:hypothetical protein